MLLPARSYNIQKKIASKARDEYYRLVEAIESRRNNIQKKIARLGS